MLNRRAFIQGLTHSPILGVIFPPIIARQAFQIGIADFVVHGQMKPEVALTVINAMSDIFAVPGKAKPTFQIGGPTVLGTRLQKQDIHLAIMTGIEYGWIHADFPELRPLVTAYTSDIRLNACILVPLESQVKNLSELRGQSIVLPRRLQHYPLLYLQQRILEQGAEPKQYFSKVLSSNDSDEAVEMVVEKKAASILVDMDSWNGYQERKPGRARKLRMVDKSDPFPTAVTLYHPDAWSEKDLQLLKELLCTAHSRPFTRQILNFWRISKFVPHSTDYQTVVKKILNEIPKPMLPFCPEY